MNHLFNSERLLIRFSATATMATRSGTLRPRLWRMEGQSSPSAGGESIHRDVVPRTVRPADVNTVQIRMRHGCAGREQLGA
jgi:hypothetical protein